MKYPFKCFQRKVSSVKFSSNRYEIVFLSFSLNYGSGGMHKEYKFQFKIPMKAAN